MQNSNQMRFAMAIHMLQRSNPATRQVGDSKHGTARRHLERVEPTVARRRTAESHPS